MMPTPVTMTMPGGISVWLYTALTIWYATVVISCIIVVLSDNRNPIKSLAWVTALLFLPVVGLLFYFFFGRNPRNNFLAARNRRRHDASGNRRRTLTCPADKADASLSALLTTVGDATYTINNEIEIFTSGEAKFKALCDDLRGARESILLQYYIFTDDELGMAISDILKQKAAEGVKVRVIYDHVGSFSASNSFFKSMKTAGIDVHPFFRVTFPQLANRINWRNHRKIVVIDRRIGYIGGMNIAKRYIMGDKRFPVWRDTHFRLRGEIVTQLLKSFVTDWNYMKDDTTMRLKEGHAGAISSAIGMQLLTTGPDDRWHGLALAFQRAILSARKSICIQTPYFLPPESLRQALEAASMAGIDVKIMIPAKSDSRMLSYASFSYIKRCLKAGIEIYLYEKGMLHSKAMIIDDDLVTCGSANFDFRSFENNFEGNIFVYDHDFNSRMRKVWNADLLDCRRLELSTWSRRPRSQRMMESVIRLFSPIL